MSYETELASVQAMITKIETGAQEHEHGDDISRRRVKLPDIAVLYRERKRLQLRVARESTGGIRVRGASFASDF